MAEIPRPPHAYVPGQTPRHQPGVFAALHASVREGMTPAELGDTLAFRAGLTFLDEGFHWEAHEALEPVWMALPPNSPERALVQGIIQIANASLKERMVRPNAVRRLCDLAEVQLRAAGDASLGGVDAKALESRIAALRARANPVTIQVR